MSIVVQSTSTLRLTATFLDFNPETGEEVPISADSVTGYIYKFNPSTEVYDLTGNFTPIFMGSGVYYHDWVPGSNGKFKIIFEAVVQLTETVLDTRVFYVGDLNPEVTLGANKTYYFLGELHPLYISPEEILQYYPSGNAVEITEYIYWASKELEKIVGKTDITDLTPLMHDYLVASVLCRLSRIYVVGNDMMGSSTGDSFQLGDLQVSSQTGGRTGSSSVDNLAEAGTWCELAALLQSRLNRGSANLKAVVKGSNFKNPIPERHLRRFE